MRTSKRRAAPTLSGQALALAAGAWAELGVSGWTSSHQDWAIDPEPLILFSAWLLEREPRLRHEATDWCVRNWRHVSVVRLKNLLRRQPAEVDEAFGEFAATVNTHAGTSWPGATEARRYRVTGRSTLPSLDRPSLAWVRLRSTFGTAARSEILRSFLSQEAGLVSAARLVVLTGYSKRNVAEGCEMLQRAGVLSVRTRGNVYYYSLAHRAELEAFVGELPAIRPNWTAVLNVTRELVALEERAHETGAQEASLATLPVHVAATLRRLQDDLDELDIEAPSEGVRGGDLWPAVQGLGSATLGQWSVGGWSPCP